MNKIQSKRLFCQLAVEIRLFWRNRQAVYLTFLLPLLGMAMFVYLNQEGVLEKLFNILVRGLGRDLPQEDQGSPMVFWTLGLIVYCIIDAAFESPLPQLVRQRDAGILKRLGGAPLQPWVLLMAKTLNASLLIFIQVAVVLAMGLASSDIAVAGSCLSLAIILLLGVFTVAGLGWALSGLIQDADGAIVAVHAVYIPALLLCGAFVPLQAMPGALQTVARALPLTYLVELLRSVMVDGTDLAANGGDLLALLAWMLGGWIIAIKTFRWE